MGLILKKNLQIFLVILYDNDRLRRISKMRRNLDAEGRFSSYNMLILQRLLYGIVGFRLADLVSCPDDW